jgi:hypothetical protein
MGMIFILNRRSAFFLTFFVVFFGWLSVHNLLTNNTKFDWFEFILLLSASFGSAIYVARRFPPMGKRL